MRNIKVVALLAKRIAVFIGIYCATIVVLLVGAALLTAAEIWNPSIYFVIFTPAVVAWTIAADSFKPKAEELK